MAVLLRALAVVALAVLLMSADAGQVPVEGTVCYVYNQRTGKGQWVSCRVREMLSDGGTNPDGGARR